MTLTPDELIDRAEIEDALHSYAQAQDQNAWHLFDGVFAEDARIELRGLSIPPLAPAQLRSFLQEFNRSRLSGQHLITNTLVQFEGETARSVSEVFHLTLQTTDKEGMFKRSRGGSLYADEWVRGSEGWRITHRVVTQKHLDESEIQLNSELIATISLGSGIDWFAADLKQFDEQDQKAGDA